MPIRRLIFAVIAALVVPASAHAAGPDCASPRAAADSLFVWQQPATLDLVRASACLAGEPGATRQQRAVQLRQVLNARGLYVPVPALPADANFRNEAGEHRILPLPDDAPWLALERGPDGDWRYAEDTLNQLPALYKATFSRASRWFQSHLPPVFYQSVLGAQLWQWSYALLLALGAWGVGRGAWWLLRRRAQQLVRRLRVPLDEKKFQATASPLVWVAVAGVFLWSIPDLQLGLSASDTLLRVSRIAVALTGMLAVSRFVDVIADVAAARAAQTEHKLDDQLVPLVHQASRVVLMVVGGLFVVGQLGVDVWKLMAGVSLGSLAFALAAQDSAANLFGAANIFIDKPFQIGDDVVIGGVEGTVEEVGFRSVKVRTYTNSLVTIPNSAITNSNVDNLGKRNRRRVRFFLGLTYDTPLDRLQGYVAGLRAVLAAHPKVDEGFQVHFHAFGPSSLDILVQYHVKTPNWAGELECRADINGAALTLGREQGVAFAFPSTSVYVEATPAWGAGPPAARPEAPAV